MSLNHLCTQHITKHGVNLTVYHSLQYTRNGGYFFLHFVGVYLIATDVYQFVPAALKAEKTGSLIYTLHKVSRGIEIIGEDEVLGVSEQGSMYQEFTVDHLEFVFEFRRDTESVTSCGKQRSRLGRGIYVIDFRIGKDTPNRIIKLSVRFFAAERHSPHRGAHMIARQQQTIERRSGRNMCNTLCIDGGKYLIPAAVEHIHNSIAIAECLKEYLQAGHMRRIVCKSPNRVSVFVAPSYRSGQ